MNPELLGNLRDIHEPLPPPFWPPAPGWWILAFLILVLIAVATYLAWRRYRAIERARMPYRVAERELARHSPTTLTVGVTIARSPTRQTRS